MSAHSIYPRLFSKLFASPLMLHGPVRSTFEQTLIRRMFGSDTPSALIGSADTPVRSEASGGQSPRKRSSIGDPPSGLFDADFEELADFSKSYSEFQQRMRIEKVFRKFGNVAVVKIDGVIDKRISQFDLDCYGGCDLADIDEALSICGGDPSIEKVVLDLNTPGGSVTGTPETAARVAALRESKEVHAFIDCLCCSAGYYIASQADHIAAARSACIGSIGVYMAVLDATRAFEMEGYRVQMMKSGRYKAMGAPWNPLSKEESAMLQEQCDAIYAAFKGAVNSQRPKVKDSTMQGQWFDGSQADDLYLVDELTPESLDEYVSRLLLL